MLSPHQARATSEQGDYGSSFGLRTEKTRKRKRWKTAKKSPQRLVALAKKLPRKNVQPPKVHGLGEPVGKPNDKVTVEYLIERMLCKDRDIYA
jgi:hypothetical protein